MYLTILPVALTPPTPPPLRPQVTFLPVWVGPLPLGLARSLWKEVFRKALATSRWPVRRAPAGLAFDPCGKYQCDGV